MIKKSIVVIALFMVIFLVSCQRYKNYFTPIEVNLNKYQNIHIQWVDFREKDWRVHGYQNIEDWKNDIEYLNQTFQYNLESYWLVGKKVTFSKKIDSKDYPKDGLLITFDDIYIDYNHYNLYLSIKFIDISTNKLLLEIYRDKYFGNSYGFTGYLSCSLDNISQRISWIILQKKMSNMLG